jgi:chemotaxis response regulator CheB
MDTPQGSASEAGTVRVLVVDDHCTFAELVVVALALEQDLDCVGAAHDADSARRMTRELSPDVILMDVNLGDQDGLDLTAELVKEHPELRVVVLTAHAGGRGLRAAPEGRLAAGSPERAAQRAAGRLRRASGLAAHARDRGELVRKPRRAAAGAHAA